MTSEVLLKHNSKNSDQPSKGSVHYFISPFPEVELFKGKKIPDIHSIHVVSQDFKSTLGFGSTIFDKRVENTIVKAHTLGLDVPSYKVLYTASLTLEKLNELKFSVDFINPSQDGGVILELNRHGHYFLIEIFNDGDIVLLKRNGENREVFDLDRKSLFELIGKI
jgi:hypothetical protein